MTDELVLTTLEAAVAVSVNLCLVDIQMKCLKRKTRKQKRNRIEIKKTFIEKLKI